MFKAQVLRRNFSLFNRVPYSRIVRSAARDGHDSVTIQRVRISRPVFGKSRLIGTVAIAAAFYGVGRYLGVEVEVELVDDANRKSRPSNSISNGDATSEESEEAADEEEEEEEEYDDAILFLPTGFSKQKPQTFYRGSDPEWQEFKKLATDRPRVERIRNELVSMMRTMAQRTPGYEVRIGKVDTSKGNKWVEVKFPDGPPREYERPGIELTEDLEWRRATRPVEPIHHARLSRVLFPTEVSNALYQDTKRKAELSWRSFRSYIGWEETSEPATVQTVVQKAVANAPSPSAPGVQVAPAATSSPSSPATESKPTTETTSSLSSQAKELGFVLPDPKRLTLDLSQFRQDFRKAFKPYPPQPPRGSVVVLGLIDIVGERARLTLNVTAAYDPKQGRYVSVQASIWNITENTQRPKGGN
ncbi:hypothetical protein FB567DRAFT_496750 [Paraphoma chrysanthemicola]|uniref:Uncharacterized protein n=1 Tax=Paraphoma chrysanthemicola TaxID=798071 RepID=A0A8K0VY35_9PLEO|nr:hypothetical protein FB567DRAFT_496750 [Paraphoma chrysanthemicola]